MKKINLIKTLIAAGSIAAIAIPTIALTNTGCSGNSNISEITITNYEGFVKYLTDHVQDIGTHELGNNNSVDTFNFIHNNANLQLIFNGGFQYVGTDIVDNCETFKITVKTENNKISANFDANSDEYGKMTASISVSKNNEIFTWNSVFDGQGEHEVHSRDNILKISNFESIGVDLITGNTGKVKSIVYLDTEDSTRISSYDWLGVTAIKVV